MSFFDRFRQRRSKEAQVPRRDLPERRPGDGHTMETAIKLVPPQDPVKVRAIREQARAFVEKWKPELLPIYAKLGPVEVNRALDTIVAEIEKKNYLEGALGKKGSTWKSGQWILWKDNIFSQEIIFNSGKKVTVYFDFSDYDSLADRVP